MWNRRSFTWFILFPVDVVLVSLMCFAFGFEGTKRMIKLEHKYLKIKRLVENERK